MILINAIIGVVGIVMALKATTTGGVLCGLAAAVIAGYGLIKWTGSTNGPR